MTRRPQANSLATRSHEHFFALKGPFRAGGELGGGRVSQGVAAGLMVGCTFGARVSIGKIGLDGSLLACSYLGKDAVKNIEGIAVDASGNIYVTGATPDPGFPVAGVPFQSAYGPDRKAGGDV
jgi:Beta-propeller repeat